MQFRLLLQCLVPWLLLSVGCGRDSDPQKADADRATGNAKAVEVRPRATLSTGLPNIVLNLALSSDGQHLIVKDFQKAQIWDTKESQKLHEIKLDQGSSLSVAMAPDGTNAAYTGGTGSWLIIDDVKTGKQVHVIRTGFTRLNYLTWSPKGDVIVICANDDIYGYDPKSGKESFKWSAGQQEVTALSAFFEDGKKIASGGKDGTVKIWDVASGKPVQHLTGGPKGKVEVVAASSDGKKIAWVPLDGPIQFWDTQTGKQQRTLKWSSPWNPTRFLADGKTIALPKDNEIILQAVETGATRQSLRAHKAVITDMAVSFDGSILASVSRDGMICLWDVNALKEQ
jgi:WD40 repeat protein